MLLYPCFTGTYLTVDYYAAYRCRRNIVMAGNTFGTYFKITTWGESHGKALGVVIDGCPAGLSLSEADIQTFLDRRKPGAAGIPLPERRGMK